MAAVRSYDQIRFRPGAVECPGAFHGAYYIISPLNDNARDMANPMGIAQKLIIRIEESAINEVVNFYAGEGEGKLVLLIVAYEFRLRDKL